jgi:diguanylate cyclase
MREPVRSFSHTVKKNSPEVTRLMFDLDTTTMVLAITWSLAAVVTGLLSGFVIGRTYTLNNETKRLKEDRARTLSALISLMESTNQLNNDVDHHHNELVSARKDIMEIEPNHDFSHLQNRLVKNISRVVESNRRMENDLVVSRYQLEAQAQELDRTRLEARTDSLCAVGNRKAFDESTKFMISRLQTSDAAFGMLLVDIDHFKRINDSFGHDAGDEVLVNIGQALKECVRPDDIVFRIGGDEFAILLEGVSAETAKLVGTRIRSTIERFDFSVGNKGSSTVVTMSMGMAVASRNDNSETIYKRADLALYESKAQGRNRLQIAYPEGEEPAPAKPAEDKTGTFNSYEQFKASFQES